MTEMNNQSKGKIENAKIVLVMAVVLALALTTGAYAGTISISSVSIPTSVVSGSGFTITVQISVDSVPSPSAVLSGAALSSQISCSPTGSQSISIVSETGSASWSCTANVAGDYSNQLTATISGLDGEGTERTAASSTGLAVLSPAAITSSSTVSGTATAGTAFTYRVGINNAGTQDATGVAITVSPPAGVSCTSTSVSGETIANGLSSYDFSCTAASAGTYVLSSAVSSDNAGSSSTTYSVTAAASGGGDSPAGGAAAGGAGGIPSNDEVKTIDFVVAGIANYVDLNETKMGGLDEFIFSSTENLTNATFVVRSLGSLPASVPFASLVAGGARIYSNFSILSSKVNSTNLAGKAKIKFNIPKTWLAANNLDPSKVRTYRYVEGAGGTGWTELATAKTGEDSGKYYFAAETPGFSYFAIVVDSLSETPTSSPQTPTTTARSGNETEPTTTVPGLPQEPSGEPSGGTSSPARNYLPYAVAGLCLIVIAGVYLYFKKKE
ncbi:MAG: PGF-pre-PGF domain-containing protein [archaeon]